jgi:hypothetical protein
VITETQSFAFDVRDTFYNVVTADSFFTGYTFRKNKMLQLQPELIPYLCVYLVDETMVPDGDANAGCIRFSHTARIGFSIIIQNNDGVAGEQTSDQAYLRIMALLYTNPTVMNVLTTKNVEGVNIEGIVRGTRRHLFGNTGLNNETPFIELQYEAHVFFRTEWYPDITDTLDEIDVTVKPNNDPDANTFDITYTFNTLRKNMVPTKKGNGHG